MTYLEVEGLTAGYGRVPVIRDLSLTVDEGSITVILGANGAGKTTTLRALSGMIRSSGSVRLGGTQLVGLSSEKVAAHGVAHVPQGRGTFGDLTVEENLRAGAYLLRRRGVSTRLQSWFDFFPRLAERRGQQASGLSGGEQQMLAIARAMMSDPKLLILDEPSLGLAPKITQDLFEQLRALNETGLTIVVVEQNAHLALGIGSQAFVLEAGRIVSSGTAASMQNNDAVRRAYLGI